MAAQLLLFAAGTVWAGAPIQVLMRGGWLQQRGSVNIPSWVVPLGQQNKSLFGIDDPTIPGAGFVTVVPGNPAGITIPPQLFQLDTARAIPLQAALSAAFGPGLGGDVIQLTTQFNLAGPGATGVMAANGTSLRLAPNFSFCPGATNNPVCATNIAGGGDGTMPGRITYTAGPNRFGGTMGMLISGIGEVANSLGGTPLRIRHDAILGGGSQEVGLAYANTSSVVLVGGNITTGATFTANGLIGMAGTTTGMAPPDTNINTGFPWTTGRVVVSEPGGVTTMDMAEMYTMTGSDNRTSNGRGTLSLVAGGISHRLVSGQTFVSVDKVTMDFLSNSLVPALSMPSAVALASLVIIGGGYVLRRRF